jgi:gliding motility-associated-like protein
MTVGSSTLTNGASLSKFSAFIAKFNATTGTPLWAQGAGGTNGAFGVGLKVDGTNNVYMTGGYADPAITFGSTTITRPYPGGATRLSLFLVQYSSSDVVTWSKTIASPTQPIYGYSIALAACGQVWVSGYYKENANVDGTIMPLVPGPDPAFIVGYTLSGGVAGYSGLASGADDQIGIAADASGNIYMCADYEVNATYPTFSIGPDVLPPLTGEHFYIGKYAPIAPPDTTYATKDTALLCGVTSATLTATPGYSAWVWDDGSTLPTRTITGPGTYYVYNMTCGSPLLIDTFHVSLIPADTTFASRDTSVCTGIGTATLTAPAGYTTYTWNTGAITPTIVAITPGTYFVRCVVACSMLVDTFHFTYTPNDTTFHRRDTSLCAVYSPITLHGPAGYASYIWSTGATTSSIAPSSSGLYEVYATTGCITRVDTFSLTYNPMPSVSLGNDTGLCVGDTLVLSSLQPASSTYLWNTGATGSSITASATGSYWLQVTNTFGCITTDTIHITVSSPLVVNLGPDTTSCIGSPVTLHSSVTYPATTTYLWSSGSTASSYVATATGTYWLTVFNFGCHATDTIHVAIVFDTLTLYTHNTAICIGASVTVAATSDPGIHCQWTPTAGIPVSNVMTPTITPDTSATYVLTASYPGCPDLIDSFHIDVQPYPTVYLGGNRFVCKNDTLHIHAMVSPSWYMHYGYNWSPGQYFDDSTNADVTYTPGDTMKIYVTVSTPASCKGRDSAMIYVFPDSFAHLDTTLHICPHDSVQLKPTSTDDLATYRWHPSMYISDTTAAQPWVKAITTQNYIGVATSQHGCRDTLHAHVSVSPTGVIYLGDDVTLYSGESYQLSPQTNCTSFYWSPAAGLTDAYIVNPIAMPAVNTRYILYGTTALGCPATDSINIYLGDDILGVPNAFTPGTGINNLFKVVKRGIVRLNYMRVYNRWGNLVYETTDIDAGWDGTYKGVPQPLGVFVYQLQAVTGSGRVVEQHGNVTLLR